MSTVMWIPFPKLRKAMRRKKTTWNCENCDSGIIDKNHCQKITKMILRAKIGLMLHFCVIFILLSPFNLTPFFFTLSFFFFLFIYCLYYPSLFVVLFFYLVLLFRPFIFSPSAPYFRFSFVY